MDGGFGGRRWDDLGGMDAPPLITPLQPREFFGRPWAGEGEWMPRRWLSWLPGPRRFRFRSFTSWISDELWLVHDTMAWEGGLEERRDGTARLVSADRIRFTYDDMVGGAEIQLRADGFSFTPYRMLVASPMLPVPVQVRAQDTCRWDASAGVLDDTIDLRLMGLPLGRLVTRLRPDGADPLARAGFDPTSAEGG
jgi:hypothetical protein